MYYTEEKIYLDGKWVKAKDASLTLYNQSLHYGNAVLIFALMPRKMGLDFQGQRTFRSPALFCSKNADSFILEHGGLD